MKNITWQVTSLEWSKKLKELGVKQESLFYWWKPKDQTPFIGDLQGVENVWGDSPYGLPSNLASAFTVAELGEIISKNIISQVNRDGEKWVLGQVDGEDKARWTILNFWTADTEADARAKMLCYLLENGLIATPLGA